MLSHNRRTQKTTAEESSQRKSILSSAVGSPTSTASQGHPVTGSVQLPICIL